MKIFFSNINVYDFFSDLGRKIVVLCWWISNRLSKKHFFCLEELFQEGWTFSEKNFNSSVFSIRILAERFQNFWEKWNFDGKISVRLSKLLSLLPEGIFGHFFRKRFKCKKIFATGAELRWVLSKIFGSFVKRASRRPDAFVEEKYMFFWRNNRLQMFFSRSEEYCWTLAKYF